MSELENFGTMKSEANDSIDTSLEIAVIGMAGRFPGAEDTGQFWENLKNGSEAVSFYSEDELLEAEIDPDLLGDTNFVKSGGGLLADKEYFDAAFFGYSAGEAELLDPQVRIFHECSWHALEDAGYDPFAYDGLIGLYAGASFNLFWEALSFLTGRVDVLGVFTSELLIDRDYLCSRVSYNLNLKGPSVIVKSACSTSLVAVHMGCQAVLNGECDMALAGGVTVTRLTKTGYLYVEDQVVSKDGHCRAFAAEACGTVFGDGVGVVVLKRLEEARSDGDNIYAVIKGTAVNNDGIRKAGYAAPSIVGQAEVICEALEAAEVEPESITYIESHGTGTSVGDPIEIEGLKTAFNTDKKGFCGLGSVKTNVGHLDSAAGVTGLIKTVLALKNRLIPASLFCGNPDPKIDFENSPFYVNTRLKEWQRNGSPLRAGVSSFGIGGTNAHAVLEEAPHSEPSSPGRTWKILPVSARSQPALERASANLSEFLRENPAVNLADAAYTLQVGRKSFPYRRMLVCRDVEGALTALSTPGSVRSFLSKEDKNSLVFMFAGLGSHYVNMGADIYQTESLFREEMDRCFEIAAPLLGYDLKEILYPSLVAGSADNVDSAGIDSAENTQLIVFVLEYALAKLLMAWGIKPHAMIGYSLGEYTAACLSGVFSLQDALEILVIRGRLIRRIKGGTMLSVPLPLEELKPLLIDGISIAIDNGPSCVAAGPTEIIDEFEKQLKAKRYLCMKLPNSHAIHSPMMEPVLREFEEQVGKLQLRRPEIPYISNVTGTWITVQEAVDPAYWAKHLRETVRFADGIAELKKEPDPVFIEIGPGRDLRSLLVRHKEDEAALRAVNLIRPQQQDGPDDRYLANRLGQLWLYGVPIDWRECYTGEKRRRIPMPLYSFDRQRFWFEGNPLSGGAAVPFGQSLPAKKADTADWFYIPQWRRSALSPDAAAPGDGANWLLFSDGSALSTTLAQRLRRVYGNGNVVTVRVGETFAAAKKQEYRVNPAEFDDYDKLFAKLAEEKKVPGYIVHLWALPDHAGPGAAFSIDELDRSQDAGLYSLLNIAKATGKNSIYDDIVLSVITSSMQPVTGEERLRPEKATVLGPVKVIPLEYPNITCLSIDIENPRSNKQKINSFIDNLPREFGAGIPGYRVAAYRGSYRWVESFEPVRLQTPPQHSLLKEKGVYLITGGFGGMGFALTEHLAQTLQARLIVVDMLTCSGGEDRDEWLSSEKRQQEIEAKKARIAELEAAGAEIRIYDADVSNYERMKEVAARAKERFGCIDGVIHTAGLIDYAGIIQGRTRQATENLLAAKVRGTLILDDVVKDQKPDFFVLFSSMGNLFYRLKFGQVGYNAGHEFVDAFAYKKEKEGVFTVAIDWNDWTEVGMAVRAEEQRDPVDTSSQVADILSISPAQGIDAFNRILGANFPRVFVFSRDLGQVLEFMNRAPGDEQALEDSFGSPASGVSLHERPELDSSYAAPESETQQKLAGIWQKIFAIKQVGIDDDFFDLGGDSLLAGVMVSQVNQQLGIRAPLTEVYNKPTIRKLAEFFSHQGEDRFAGVDEHLVLFKESPEEAENFFFIYNGTGEVGAFYELANRLPGDFNVWGVRSKRIENYTPMNLTFEEFAADTIVRMKTLQPHGPYYLTSWCSGGLAAYEVCRQLEQMNEEVKFLGLIDSFTPYGSPDNFPDYTLETELNWILQVLMGDEIKKRTAGLTEINRLWPIIIDYLEEIDFDKEMLKQIMPENMPLAYPNLDQMTLREMMFNWNMVRTFERAEKLYNPEGKVSAPTYLFIASEEDICHPESFHDYCETPPKWYPVTGDHFNIFHLPRVVEFSEIFNKALQDALSSQ